MEIRSARDLIVYQKAYQLAMAKKPNRLVSLHFARDCGYITAQQHANSPACARKSAKCSAASSTTPPHSCSLPPEPLPSAPCPLLFLPLPSLSL